MESPLVDVKTNHRETYLRVTAILGLTRATRLLYVSSYLLAYDIFAASGV